MLSAEVEKGHMLSAEVEKGHMLSAEVEKGQMLASHNTKYTADSIEACPYERDSWLCATYQLVEATQGRVGDLTLFQYKDSLVQHASLEVGGVLDMKWSGKDSALCAMASGELVTLQINEDRTSIEVTERTQLSEGILLAVDCNGSEVVSSDTLGNVYYSVDNKQVTRISTHGHGGWGPEVWGLALGDNVVYTGGDDCLFKVWDLRSSTQIHKSRYHEMGVCCIAPRGNVFLTGSYDESVCMWDSRTYKMLGSCKVGGGVWRLKWHPEKPYIMVAGMHSGFHIIDNNHLADSDEQSLVLDQTYSGHDSLAYGADWLDGGRVATCSFYDKLMTVWDSGLKD